MPERVVLAGRYRVLRPLGSGGMAAVLLCLDERLGREVAVKRLHAASPADAARRFAREARLGAALNHENLVTVFDTVTDDEGVLIVMEYVSGGTLRDALRADQLPPARVVRIVRDVAAGLDHAHAHGVVHRDVKPANVLLRDDGVAKLVDLGIAVTRDETRITATGTVLGTAAYMAPEQLDGVPATAATDVYALAAVAYEALTGRRARTGKTAVEIAHQLANEPPPDLRAVRPELSRAAADLLRDAMDSDPARRPRSAGELARGLGAALGERAARAPTRGAPPSRRFLPALLAASILLAAAAVVAIVIAGGGSDQGGGREVARQPETRKAPARKGPPPRERQPPASPSYSVPEPTGADPQRASELNASGFELLQEGRFAAAIPQLEEAVRLAPPGTVDPYAYALFNLGSALRQSGRADDAVKVLERRLQVPDQLQTVQQELDLAERAAPG